MNRFIENVSDVVFHLNICFISICLFLKRFTVCRSNKSFFEKIFFNAIGIITFFFSNTSNDISHIELI